MQQLCIQYITVVDLSAHLCLGRQCLAQACDNAGRSSSYQTPEILRISNAACEIHIEGTHAEIAQGNCTAFFQWQNRPTAHWDNYLFAMFGLAHLLYVAPLSSLLHPNVFLSSSAWNYFEAVSQGRKWAF